jgi:hypothetical protein
MERFRILDNQELNRSATDARATRKPKGAAHATKLKSYADQSQGRPTAQYARWLTGRSQVLLPPPTHPTDALILRSKSLIPSRFSDFDPLIVADLMTAEPLVVNLLVGTVLAQRKQSLIDLSP